MLGFGRFFYKITQPFYFRLENGWFVREISSPVLSGGTSSTVPSSPPSECENELLNPLGESPPVFKDHSDTKHAKKVSFFLKGDDNLVGPHWNISCFDHGHLTEIKFYCFHGFTDETKQKIRQFHGFLKCSIELNSSDEGNCERFF
jgi:hypothetical protein